MPVLFNYGVVFSNNVKTILLIQDSFKAKMSLEDPFFVVKE